MSNHFIITALRLLNCLNYQNDNVSQDVPCNAAKDINTQVMMDWLTLGRDFKVILEKIEKQNETK